MKHIVKDQNTPNFDEWKASANDDWQPTIDIVRHALYQDSFQGNR